MMHCDDIKPLLEAYALEALEPEEMTAVSAHLDECEACRVLNAEYSDLVTLLPGALAEASPWPLPDSLRDKTLARIADLDHPDPELTPADPWWRQLHPSQMRFWQVTAAVLLLLLLVTGGWGWWSSTALAEERAMRTLLENEFEKREIIFELVDSRVTQRTFIAPVNSESTAYGKVYTRPDMTGIVVLGGRLPSPPEGYGYHVYFTEGSSRYLGGILEVNEDGFGIMLVDTSPHIPAYNEVNYALKPLESSEAGEPVLFWESGDG